MAAVRMTDHWKMSRYTQGLNNSPAVAVLLCCGHRRHNSSHNSDRLVAARDPGPSSCGETDDTRQWQCVESV